jgi:hypothetical protein
VDLDSGLNKAELQVKEKDVDPRSALLPFTFSHTFSQTAVFTQLAFVTATQSST